MIKETSQETSASLAAKLGGPAAVTSATLAGYQISDLVLWATLIYTVLMVVHKIVQISKDVLEKKKKGLKE